MSREWKPGTLIANDEGDRYWAIEVTANTVAAGRTGRAWRDGSHVVGSDGNGWNPSHIEGAHALVVIDPEDRGAVERLLDAYLGADDPLGGRRYAHMQTALREFADPPKPPVYAHIRADVSRDGISTALCGKVWRAGADVLVVGNCPNCRDLAEDWRA